MMRRPDKRVLVGAGIGAVLLFCVLLLNFSLSAKRELKSLRERQKELAVVGEEVKQLRERVARVEGKTSVTPVRGILQAVDEVFRPLGLKQKIKSVKQTGTREVGEMMEEEAEIRVEKLDMNEMVNLFYRIENAPLLLSLRKSSVKTSFDSAARLDVTLTLALIRPK
ncbi:MAG: hypothetical protein K8I29_00190 [Alphaproteobacteria bacterium]|uniref:Uncharacterized protein n=1 Tax=Candidatus Nitrobium versatile TaxID=2884831 RepID=A0A953J4Q3_9BACT|nr:hypothetical protein [Candidatus Nitrobium versatile]